MFNNDKSGWCPTLSENATIEDKKKYVKLFHDAYYNETITEEEMKRFAGGVAPEFHHRHPEFNNINEGQGDPGPGAWWGVDPFKWIPRISTKGLSGGLFAPLKWLFPVLATTLVILGAIIGKLLHFGFVQLAILKVRKWIERLAVLADSGWKKTRKTKDSLFLIRQRYRRDILQTAVKLGYSAGLDIPVKTTPPDNQNVESADDETNIQYDNNTTNPDNVNEAADASYQTEKKGDGFNGVFLPDDEQVDWSLMKTDKAKPNGILGMTWFGIRHRSNNYWREAQSSARKYKFDEQKDKMAYANLIIGQVTNTLAHMTNQNIASRYSSLLQKYVSSFNVFAPVNTTRQNLDTFGAGGEENNMQKRPNLVTQNQQPSQATAGLRPSPFMESAQWYDNIKKTVGVVNEDNIQQSQRNDDAFSLPQQMSIIQSQILAAGPNSWNLYKNIIATMNQFLSGLSNTVNVVINQTAKVKPKSMGGGAKSWILNFIVGDGNVKQNQGLKGLWNTVVLPKLNERMFVQAQTVVYSPEWYYFVDMLTLTVPACLEKVFMGIMSDSVDWKMKTPQQRKVITTVPDLDTSKWNLDEEIRKSMEECRHDSGENETPENKNTVTQEPCHDTNNNPDKYYLPTSDDVRYTAYAVLDVARSTDEYVALSAIPQWYDKSAVEKMINGSVMFKIATKQNGDILYRMISKDGTVTLDENRCRLLKRLYHITGNANSQPTVYSLVRDRRFGSVSDGVIPSGMFANKVESTLYFKITENDGKRDEEQLPSLYVTAITNQSK